MSDEKFLTIRAPWERVIADPKDNARAVLPAVDELARDIAGSQLINPITIRADPDRDGYWRVVCGFRRHAAITSIRRDQLRDRVPTSYDEPEFRLFVGSLEEARILTLAENHDRRDLRVWDLGDWCQKLKQEHGLTGEAIAARVGYAKSTVNHAISFVTKIHPEIQDSYRHARAKETRETYDQLLELVKLPHEEQLALWQSRTDPSPPPSRPKDENNEAPSKGPTRPIILRRLREIEAAYAATPTPELSGARRALRWTLGMTKSWRLTRHAARQDAARQDAMKTPSKSPKSKNASATATSKPKTRR